MIHFPEYKYLFPPRPLNRVSPDQLDMYDNDEYIAQPKFDGSCCIVFMDETGTKVMNRHGEPITNPFMEEIDYRGMYSGRGFMVVVGELLNKNKMGEDGRPFNKKFIIWDILVYSGIYLTGKTVIERLTMLELMFKCQSMSVGAEGMESYEHICITGIKGVYKARTFMGEFKTIYDTLVKTQLYEGIVLKRRTAPLGFGFVENNNSGYMIKCRRQTLNYKF